MKKNSLRSRGEPRRTLIAYFGIDPMRQVIETRPFGEPYIRFSNFLQVCSFLYETAALLGRAKRDKSMVLEKMVASPEKEGDFIRYLQQRAEKRLGKFGAEPTSFYVFIASTELQSVGLSLTASPAMTLKKAFDEKWPLKTTEPFIKILGTEGIGFGSKFPDLTEKMYKNAHENVDMKTWSEMKAHGVILPERPTVVSLEQQERATLTMLASYASEYFPELVGPLGLSST